jgi:hypothetical protein
VALNSIEVEYMAASQASCEALESSKNVKKSIQCSDKEETKFSKLLGGLQNVFAWSYEDIHGFDLGLTQHDIPIKEDMKLARKKQGPINSAFKSTFQKELENFLEAGIIFPVYPEWVSNWIPFSNVTDHIRNCIHFRTLGQDYYEKSFSSSHYGNDSARGCKVTDKALT